MKLIMNKNITMLIMIFVNSVVMLLNVFILSTIVNEALDV
jgi:hypothetical protein